MKQRKKGIWILAVFLLPCILWGCADSTDKKENQKEQLAQIIVGSDDYPPFNYVNENGEVAGIDVELAKEAFSRMGYEAVFQKIDWENKKDLVESGQIDCIWGCFSMEGRKDEYQWAGPYMVSRQVVAVNENSDIYTLADLQGKTIAVQATTKPEGIFLGQQDARIPQVKEVYSFENRDLLYTSLGEEYVDAIAAHETAIEQYIKDYGINYRILDESLMTVGLGVAFANDDDRGLNEELTKVFKEMKEDGTEKKIIEKYLPNADKYLEVENIED